MMLLPVPPRPRSGNVPNMRQRRGEFISLRGIAINILTGGLVLNVNGERSNAVVNSHASVVAGA